LGDAKEDWTILRAFSGAIGKTLPYDNIDALRNRMIEANPAFDALGEITPATWEALGAEGQMDGAPFVSPVENFYMTDPISRASITMARCTDVHAGGTEKTGTDG
jgi:NADH-quinone oxidoreductase subunit G